MWEARFGVLDVTAYVEQDGKHRIEINGHIHVSIGSANFQGLERAAEREIQHELLRQARARAL